MGQEHQTYLLWDSLTFHDVILIYDNPNIRATLSRATARRLSREGIPNKRSRKRNYLVRS